MTTYRIYVTSTSYGYIDIEANNKSGALELFNEGSYDIELSGEDELEINRYRGD